MLLCMQSIVFIWAYSQIEGEGYICVNTLLWLIPIIQNQWRKLYMEQKIRLVGYEE